MEKQDEIYIESVKEWLKEQELRLEELTKTIELSQKIIDSNKKQGLLLCESTGIAVGRYNEWAEQNNAEKIETFVIPPILMPL